MNIVQVQNRVQELPNSPQTMQYLTAALNGQVTTVPPYIAAVELKRRETEGMMDKLAQGAANAPTSTVKDKLEEKVGIMALMGQRQPPQPPQIPQPAPPEQQPQAGGIDSLPVKEDMFGMADGGIVGYSGGGDVQRFRAGGVGVASQPPISIQELTRLYQRDPQLAREAALRAGPAGARMLERVARFARAAGPAGLVLEGGLAASGDAANTIASMSPEQRKAFYENPMLGAMGGDAGIAAAIMNAPDMKSPESSSGSQIGKGLAFLAAPFAAAADVAISPLTLLRRSLTTPLSKDADKPPSFTPVMDARNRLLYGPTGEPAPAKAVVPASTGEASMAGQDAINAALKAAGASTSKLPAMTQGQRASTVAKPPPVAAAKPPLDAARPPVDAGISLADQAPGLNLADALDMDPAVRRMKELAAAANPYGGPQESQADYIKRMTEGIRSQIPGGKMPFETSEARLKDIEARRAKEDTDYAESNKGRQLDNLLTMISGMGRGSFGNAGAQGIEAVQKVERSQREEDLKRKDLRDQQSMKLMEIRSLNDQAQMALAQGNVQAYEKLTQEAKKLKIDFDTTQASLNKDVATLGSTARTKDVDVAENRKKLAEESRQKQLEREKDIQVERIRVAGQAAARASGADDKTVKMAEDAFTRDPEAQAIKKRLESSVNPAKRQTDLDRLREIQAEKYRQFGIKLEGAPSPAPAAGGNTRMRFDAQGNPIK